MKLLLAPLLALGNLFERQAKPCISAKSLARRRLPGIDSRVTFFDKQIVSLLNERARFALEIRCIRQRERIQPSFALGRQEEVLRNAMANSADPLSPAAARLIYEKIIRRWLRSGAR